MRNLTTLLLLIFLVYNSFSQGVIKNKFGGVFMNNTTYFFSASGNDSNSGLDASHPITINKIGSLTLNENDVFLFNKGDSFVLGDIIISIGSIQVSSYGTGSQPKLIGSSDLSTATWVNNGDGTYYTSLATSPLWIYINGLSARNAESAPVTVTGTSGSTISGLQATLDGWNSTQSLIGAKLRCTEQDWTGSVEYTVTGYSAGTITVGSTITSAAANITNQFYLYQQKQWMTSTNDWFYDASAQRLYIKTSVSPTTMNIRQGIYNGLFSTYKKLTISNVDLSNYQLNTLDASQSRSSSITSCTIHDCRNHAVFATNAHDLYVNGNTIYNMDGNGMFFFGNINTMVTNNTLSFVDYGLSRARKDYTNYPGWPDIGFSNFITQGAATTGQGIVLFFCWLPKLQYNTIHHTSNDGIQTSCCTGPFVDSNYIHDYGTYWTDNGAIHNFGNGLVFSPTNTNGTFSNNVIYNAPGVAGGKKNAGIYIDGPAITDDVYQNVLNNSIANYSGTAVLILCGKNHTITGNNLISAPNTVFKGVVHFFVTNTVGCIMKFNRIVNAVSPNGNCVFVVSTGTPFASGGSSDNNQYVNPYSSTIATVGSVSKTFAQWQAQYSTDASSTSRSNYISYSNSTNAIHECNIEMNPALTVESFNVPAGYSDCQSSPFSNPVSIAAFSALIYLKDTSFP